MSIDDDFFDIEDILKTVSRPDVAKVIFSRIEKYVARLEAEHDRLSKENVAMRKVIKIVGKE